MENKIDPERSNATKYSKGNKALEIWCETHSLPKMPLPPPGMNLKTHDIIRLFCYLDIESNGVKRVRCYIGDQFHDMHDFKKHYVKAVEYFTKYKNCMSIHVTKAYVNFKNMKVGFDDKIPVDKTYSGKSRIIVSKTVVDNQMRLF